MATGQPRYYAESTIKNGLPAGVVRREPRPTVYGKKETEKSREEMIAFLESKGIRTNPRIGDEKLKQRYHENQE